MKIRIIEYTYTHLWIVIAIQGSGQFDVRSDIEFHDRKEHDRYVIYIIRFSLCNVFYVAQTKRSACDRLKDHLSDRRFNKDNINLKIKIFL